MNTRRENPFLLLGCITLAFVPALGAVLSRPGPWYRSLKKPKLNPPSFVFAPIWSALYLCIGLAHYRFLLARSTGHRNKGNLFYGLQLALNAAWTPIFFGLRRPKLALIDLALLLLAVAATEREFARCSPAARKLLSPYLVWLCFATYLNAGICVLNRETQPALGAGLEK